MQYHDIDYIKRLLSEVANEATYDMLWRHVCRNPHALTIIEKKKDEIHWDSFYYSPYNPKTFGVLENKLKNNPQSIANWDWDALTQMPEVFCLVQATLNQQCKNWRNPIVVYFRFASNTHPDAIAQLEQAIENIGPSKYLHWDELSGNPSAIHILEKYLYTGYVDWDNLSGNPNAIHLLERNLDRVSWWKLSQNPNAIHLLERNPEKIRWNYLAINPSPDAVRLLKPNLDKLNYVGWFNLGRNPNVALIMGKLDRNKMRTKCADFARELAEAVFHPSRLLILCDTYDMNLVDYMEALGD